MIKTLLKIVKKIMIGILSVVGVITLIGVTFINVSPQFGAGAILSSSVVLANVTKSFGDSTGSFNTRFNIY